MPKYSNTSTAYPFYLVNVFAEKPFGGNPLAVFPQADGLSDEQMQSIARQFNLSETVFIFSPSDLHNQKAIADLRIFSPSDEMPLAGHPILGSAFVLSKMGNIADEFILNTKAKPVHILIDGLQITFKLNGYDIVSSGANKELLADLSGLLPDDIKDGAYFVNSGIEQLLIQLNSRRALQQLQVDLLKLRALYVKHCSKDSSLKNSPLKNNDEPSVYYWVEDGEIVYSRLFFEQYGRILEDAGTGSACANLGAYLISQNRYPIIKRIHQGDEMGQANRLSLKVDSEQNIFVGGCVIKMGCGEFYGC